MVTIYPAPRADPTVLATRDHPREESEMVGMKTRQRISWFIESFIWFTELNLSNISAFIERKIELLRCYRNKKNALMQ